MKPPGLSENHDSMQISPHENTSTNNPIAARTFGNDFVSVTARTTKGITRRVNPSNAVNQRTAFRGFSQLAIFLYMFGVGISIHELSKNGDQVYFLSGHLFHQISPKELIAILFQENGVCPHLKSKG
jgi:hypothetical protein